MKKILMILSIIMLTQITAFAYVDSQYMNTDQFLHNVGYSHEMARVMTIHNADPYRTPDTEPKMRGMYLARRIFHYMSPTQFADYEFPHRNTSFDVPSWRD